MSTHEVFPSDELMVPVTAAWGALREAARTQRALMPPPVYVEGFVDAAAAMRPCRAIGGDFYDYRDLGREFHLLLGDVCGKGTPAALQAALVQGFLAVQIGDGAGPAQVVARLNRDLCGRNIAQRFVTLFYGVIARDGHLTYCNAGQCRPMLVDRHSVRRLGVGGLPVGLFCDTIYRETSVTIAPGDLLVVFSDGVSEAARHDQPFGDARILEIVNRHRDLGASDILQQLILAARGFASGRQRDDMTALVIRYLFQGD